MFAHAHSEAHPTPAQLSGALLEMHGAVSRPSERQELPQRKTVSEELVPAVVDRFASLVSYMLFPL